MYKKNLTIFLEQIRRESKNIKDKIDDTEERLRQLKKLRKKRKKTREVEEGERLSLFSTRRKLGNIVGKVENFERKNTNGEKFKVSNFSLVSKDEDGNKIYTNCSAYGDKTKDLENLKQGDFVKIFGQVKTSIDNNGKEHKSVRILSSKLLKAKEQVKSQDKDKKSILGQIKSFKTDDKNKSNKKDHSKGAER